ncbi:hypothetical protein [Corynebacterium pelargi]|uniref:Uncharacterized protein n=1 Tax=Corynebacterium pelargi TaxID=1471400 RepID=A0A410W5K5_9CORY|nr:hypothetical protein [Corynebacterium pelargi]QAU51318.1 hypothetical protein CPELA_00055 [Corynebacterium pelargi]GGG81777.1 hypothetical protein GCM10007338_20680 [Corynebacterium pelargi]
MGHSLTLSKAALYLADLLTDPEGRKPSVNIGRMRQLLAVRALHDVSVEGEAPRIDQREIEQLAANTTYIADYAEYGVEDPIFRVSLRESQVNPVYAEEDGRELRTHSGYDYDNLANLSQDMLYGTFEGVWPISDENADFAVDSEAYLLPSTVGLVKASNVRRITDWEPVADSTRKYFHTEELSPDDPLFVESKKAFFWVDVPPGRICGFDFDPNVEKQIDQFELSGTQASDADSIDELIALKMKQLKILDELAELKRLKLGLT